MKQMNDTRDESNAELPFSFKKEKVSSQKIKDHWQKIAEKIKEKQEAPAPDKITE